MGRGIRARETGPGPTKGAICNSPFARVSADWSLLSLEVKHFSDSLIRVLFAVMF